MSGPGLLRINYFSVFETRRYQLGASIHQQRHHITVSRHAAGLVVCLEIGVVGRLGNFFNHALVLLPEVCQFLIIFKDVSSDPSSIIINSKFENVCFKILPIASSKNFSPL
mgnify:CR=1 FL=1